VGRRARRLFAYTAADVIALLKQHRALAQNFLKRELQSRYVGTSVGAYLAIVQPLLQLGVYTLIFSVVFKAQMAELNGRSFVLFFAIGLWPWLMLREGVGRATQAIVSNAALVSKIAFPRELLVYTTVTASFVVHMVGFLFAIAVLALFGERIAWQGLPTWLLLIAAWYVLALALGLIFSAVQVYWRELDFILDSLWLLLFYATPILFSLTQVPAAWRVWLEWNPLAYIFTRIRDVLLTGSPLLRWEDFAWLGGAIVLFVIARRIFLRLEERFDDAL
jgi:lipopolysaccharide transport system permease protein